MLALTHYTGPWYLILIPILLLGARFWFRGRTGGGGGGRGGPFGGGYGRGGDGGFGSNSDPNS